MNDLTDDEKSICKIHGSICRIFRTCRCADWKSSRLSKKKSENFENTVIVLLSDNGASAEVEKKNGRDEIRKNQLNLLEETNNVELTLKLLEELGE